MIKTVSAAAAEARTIEIEARLERLAEVRAFVRATCTELGAADDCVVDLVQAVDEAMTNITTHGYGGASGPIEVTMGPTVGGVRVQIRDRAPAFDPTSVGEPDLDSTRLRPGGMGIHLIRAATDSMTHEHRPGGGNILTLVRTLGRREEED
ncbi:MAG TPA: ATP-binding protein [Candidatus Limnocylindrales bacterium]|nr:ATP-binding protein [Candidatus Limnocylindrales bacterium]